MATGNALKATNRNNKRKQRIAAIAMAIAHKKPTKANKLSKLCGYKSPHVAAREGSFRVCMSIYLHVCMYVMQLQ